jgi:hypothetical protein
MHYPLIALAIADDRAREARDRRLAALARQNRPRQPRLLDRLRRLAGLVGNLRSTSTGRPASASPPITGR